MGQTNNANITSLIAMIVGGLLVMGGLMFLLATSMMSDLPRMILIPPVVQIALGAIGVGGGLLLRQGYSAAKYALLFAGIAVVLNVVFLVSIVISFAA